MSTADIIMAAVVVLLGFTAAPWNRTSAALVIAWTVGIIWSRYTGDNMPLRFYVITDGFVLGMIFSKSPYREPFWLWLWQSWLDKSWCDWAIILIFIPFMWGLYVAPVSETVRYWALYYLAIAQFALAAADTAVYLLTRGRTRSDDPPPGLFRLAWARSGGG